MGYIKLGVFFFFFVDDIHSEVWFHQFALKVPRSNLTCTSPFSLILILQVKNDFLVWQIRSMHKFS